MRYEWDVAWRYLHPAAIAWFYFAMFVLFLTWGGLYAAFITPILYLFHHGYLDWLGRPPLPAYRVIGLAAATLVVVLLSRGKRNAWFSYVASRCSILFLAAFLYEFALKTEHIDEILELDPALLIATALVAGTILRPQMKVPFITVLTSTSMFGVSIGVSSIIVVLSVMNGFDKDFHKKILGVKSHVVFADGRGIPQWQRAIETLRALPGTVSVQPAAEGLALLKVRQVRSVWVRGIDPASESQGSFLRRSMLIGSLDDLALTTPSTREEMDINDLVAESVPVVIGSELAKLLFGVTVAPNLSPQEEEAAWSVVLGRPVQLVAAEIGGTAMGVPPTAYGRVAGVFSTKFYDFDASMVFVGLETGQRLYGLGGSVNRIEVRLEDYNPTATRRYAEAARTTLLENLQLSLFPDTWMDLDRVFYESLVLERRVMGLILSIIVLVASCSILTTLVMVVMEKTRDIGVLRAIGATPRGIMHIFVAQGMLIGLLGTTFGCLLAFVVCRLIMWLKLPMPGGNSIYYIDQIPVHMEFSYFFNVVAYTFLLSFLATLYPAHRAGHLTPVDAIRYE